MKKENINSTMMKTETEFNGLFDMEDCDVSAGVRADREFDKQMRAKYSNKKEKKENHSIEYYADIYLKTRSEKDFKNLFQRSWYGLYAHIHDIVKDNDTTQDMIVFVMAKVHQKIDQFDPEKAKFSTWMYRIAWNEAVQYLKRNHNSGVVDNDISNLYASTVFHGGDTDAYISEEEEIHNLSGIDSKDITMLSREDIINHMMDASLAAIDGIKDDRVKICMIEKKRSAFYNRIEANDKWVNLRKLIKPYYIASELNYNPDTQNPWLLDLKNCSTDDERWNKLKHVDMKLEDIAKKYDFPITSVKNWIHKGKNIIKQTIQTKNKDIFDMYQDI